jgi:3D (Asp-Asp-Asp) domain-containing protein
VYETFAIEQEPVPHKVIWMPDSDLEIDTQSLRQEGKDGVLQKRIRVRYEDGQEISRRLEDQGIVRPPENRIIAYGTNIIVRTMDTPAGPVEYWRAIRMLATSYSASTAGTPQTASYYGRTALGWTMRHGIVAIDPRIVRLGSNVYVPGYGIGVAADTGGAIKYRRIDLGYNDDNLKLWYRWVDVYLLTPVPSDINYVIPNWPPVP